MAWEFCTSSVSFVSDWLGDAFSVCSGTSCAKTLFQPVIAMFLHLFLIFFFLGFLSGKLYPASTQMD